MREYRRVHDDDCNIPPKARKPDDCYPFAKKPRLAFDIPRPDSTLDMIRMPLNAPAHDFARITSRSTTPREIPDDLLDGMTSHGND
jgi:hypothetical protein